MSETLGECEIRDRFVVTIPKDIRKFLNLRISDRLRWENINNNICVCRVVSHKINNRCGGGTNKRSIRKP